MMNLLHAGPGSECVLPTLAEIGTNCADEADDNNIPLKYSVYIRGKKYGKESTVLYSFKPLLVG